MNGLLESTPTGIGTGIRSDEPECQHLNSIQGGFTTAKARHHACSFEDGTGRCQFEMSFWSVEVLKIS